MIVLPGRRFAVGSVMGLPRLMRALWIVETTMRRLTRAAETEDWERACAISREGAGRLLAATDTTLELVGIENVDPKNRYVVVALHESFVDVVALAHLPLKLAWVARDELADWRMIGRFLRSRAAITVSPEVPRTAIRRLLASAPGVFDSGRSLVVFPQGALLGIEAAFSSGAFHLAKRSDVQVLPVIITGTHHVYEYPFSPRVRFGGVIRMEVLPPVSIDAVAAGASAIEQAMRARALAAHPQPRRYRPSMDGYWDGYSFEISEDFPEVRRQLAEHRRRQGDH